jgi:hypothetical protein
MPGTPNIMVLSTFGFSYNYLSASSSVLHTFLVYSMQQSCKIFVKTDLKTITIGAECRNI